MSLKCYLTVRVNFQVYVFNPQQHRNCLNFSEKLGSHPSQLRHLLYVFFITIGTDVIFDFAYGRFQVVESFLHFTVLRIHNEFIQLP